MSQKIPRNPTHSRRIPANSTITDWFHSQRHGPTTTIASQLKPVLPKFIRFAQAETYVRKLDVGLVSLVKEQFHHGFRVAGLISRPYFIMVTTPDCAGSSFCGSRMNWALRLRMSIGGCWLVRPAGFEPAAYGFEGRSPGLPNLFISQ